MTFEVCIDKFIATKKQEKYLYEFQFSSVSRSTLLMLVDLALCKLSGAWLQSDGSYVVQCSFYELPEHFIEYIMKEL